MKVSGERVYLRRLEVSDLEEVLAYELRNRALFQQVQTTQTEDRLTPEKVLASLHRYQNEWEQDKGYAFGVFDNASHELIGRIGFRLVTRGPLQSAQLGYTVDQAQNGKGIGTEAVRLILRFAFEELKLHRIEAGVMTRNTGSNRILEKCGFTKEGLNRKNLHIFGQWEDHYIWAILESDWEQMQKESKGPATTKYK